MPTLPTSPFVNKAMGFATSIAPGQTGVLASRLAAWQGASSYTGGVTALLQTIGTRLSGGSFQVSGAGTPIYKQAYPAGISYR